MPTLVQVQYVNMGLSNLTPLTSDHRTLLVARGCALPVNLAASRYLDARSSQTNPLSPALFTQCNASRPVLGGATPICPVHGGSFRPLLCCPGCSLREDHIRMKAF